VWQGKDLREGEFVCVAAKGVAGEFCGCVAGKGVRVAEHGSGKRKTPKALKSRWMRFGAGVGAQNWLEV